MGTGKNIPYYPEDVELTGLDFSKKMIGIAVGAGIDVAAETTDSILVNSNPNAQFLKRKMT
ncbi:MAG: hypothetical protein ACLFM7_13875 [Bacteroidales bacterium]